MTAACATRAVIVLAKSPRPGRSKTRCTPPCTPEQAAALAAAALADTLDVVAGVPGVRRVLALDGPAGPWLPTGVEVVPQRGDGLDERLAAAFADVLGAPRALGAGRAVLVGMDTPQLRAASLVAALDALDDHDAVLGDALDGGYWSIGLRRADDEVFRGVPMSTSVTGAAQRARLAALGLRTATIAPLRDVDTFDDALAVAATTPGTRFARVVGSIAAALEPAA
jgi:rSAM/selenodomain-associated transferase 1